MNRRRQRVAAYMYSMGCGYMGVKKRDTTTTTSIKLGPGLRLSENEKKCSTLRAVHAQACKLAMSGKESRWLASPSVWLCGWDGEGDS